MYCKKFWGGGGGKKIPPRRRRYCPRTSSHPLRCEFETTTSCTTSIIFTRKNRHINTPRKRFYWHQQRTDGQVYLPGQARAKKPRSVIHWLKAQLLVLRQALILRASLWDARLGVSCSCDSYNIPTCLSVRNLTAHS